MLWRRRPKVRRLAAKGDAKRLVRALGYHDQLSDSQGRLYDLGVGVRRDAALALASVADTADIDVGAALIGALGDPSRQVRRAAAAALGARREGRATAALAEAALTWQDARDEAPRLAAADALTDLSGPESAEQLVRILIERPMQAALARELVMRMVRSGGAETARGACATAAAALSANDGARADRAAEVLSWLGDIGVEPVLAALDGAQSPPVPAIRVLGWLGDLRACDPLIRLLSNGDADVRAAAAAALGEIADPASAPALVAASRDPDHMTRAAALEALGRLGPLAIAPEPLSGEAPTPDRTQRDDPAEWRHHRGAPWFRSAGR